jgi:hypothetical protein
MKSPCPTVAEIYGRNVRSIDENHPKSPDMSSQKPSELFVREYFAFFTHTTNNKTSFLKLLHYWNLSNFSENFKLW